MQKKSVSKVRNKLSSRKGESISETLIALLIAALALAMLAGAVASGSAIVKKERSRLKSYYSNNEHIVKLDSLQGPISINITLEEKNGITSSVGSEPVMYYKNEAFKKKPVVAYKRYVQQN